MKPIISILRPHQWVKNCFVLLPLFFNGGFLDVPLLLSAMTMTLAFCFAASGIYCLNDICDVEADRLHPKKCLRPVACGAVSKRSAFVLMTLCMVASISLVCLFPWQVEVDITIVDMKSGSPTKVLLEDRFVQATVLGWLLAFVILIYADR